MVYVIIGVALLLIIVPIIGVLPSAQQKAQMRMRNAARAAGVSVDLTSIDDPNPKQEKYTSNTGKALPAVLKVAAYRVQRNRGGDWRQLPKVDWCLNKTREEGWQWAPSAPEAMSDELRQWLPAAVESLPADVEQVQETEYNIMVHWHERTEGDEVSVFDFLKHCADLPLHKPVKDD
jgi:hypothetical protein